MDAIEQYNMFEVGWQVSNKARLTPGSQIKTERSNRLQDWLRGSEEQGHLLVHQSLAQQQMFQSVGKPLMSGAPPALTQRSMVLSKDVSFFPEPSRIVKGLLPACSCEGYRLYPCPHDEQEIRRVLVAAAGERPATPALVAEGFPIKPHKIENMHMMLARRPFVYVAGTHVQHVHHSG